MVRFVLGIHLHNLTDHIPLRLIQSLRNGEATKERFKNRSDFYVPEIYWDLSSRKILTMEFIDGVKVNDIEALKKLGVSPKWVRTTLLEVFAEMMYQHGVVHCDPHVRLFIFESLVHVAC